MTSKRSMAVALVDLEARIAELEKTNAFHAEREEFHRGHGNSVPDLGQRRP